jgi:hypothetical protein
MIKMQTLKHQLKQLLLLPQPPHLKNKKKRRKNNKLKLLLQLLMTQQGMIKIKINMLIKLNLLMMKAQHKKLLLPMIILHLNLLQLIQMIILLKNKIKNQL